MMKKWRWFIYVSCADPLISRFESLFEWNQLNGYFLSDVCQVRKSGESTESEMNFKIVKMRMRSHVKLGLEKSIECPHSPERSWINSDLSFYVIALDESLDQKYLKSIGVYQWRLNDVWDGEERTSRWQTSGESSQLYSFENTLTQTEKTKKTFLS